jgi:DNA-binding response OmpR family regulator
MYHRPIWDGNGVKQNGASSGKTITPDSSPRTDGQAKVLILTDDLTESAVYSFALRQQYVNTATVHVDSLGEVSSLGSLGDLIVFEISRSMTSLPDPLTEIARNRSAPVLLFTYEKDERFQLKAYEAGIGECIVKPIGISLFLAKVNAWLDQTKYSKNGDGLNAKAGGFELLLDQRHVRTPDGELIKLSQLEYRLLELLLDRPGQVFDSHLLTQRVWSEFDCENTRLLKNLVYRVRQKIEVNPRYPRHILTVPGQGYVFASPR